MNGGSVEGGRAREVVLAPRRRLGFRAQESGQHWPSSPAQRPLLVITMRFTICGGIYVTHSLNAWPGTAPIIVTAAATGRTKTGVLVRLAQTPTGGVVRRGKQATNRPGFHHRPNPCRLMCVNPRQNRWHYESSVASREFALGASVEKGGRSSSSEYGSNWPTPPVGVFVRPGDAGCGGFKERYEG
jgi:hypothetical protein